MREAGSLPRPAVQPAEALEAELARIAVLGLDDLQCLWRDLTQSSAPAVLSRDLLARLIAHRIQESRLGKLGRETRKLLDRLAQGGTEPVRHLKVGTVMVREYQGELHQVMVVPGGFSWREVTYASLSTIARAITGTSWNGPRFFGLRGATAASDASSRASPEPAPVTDARPSRTVRGSVRVSGGALRGREVRS